MQIGNGLKLAFLFALGLILILSGMHGNFGSVLAAVFVPDSLVLTEAAPQGNVFGGEASGNF